MNPKHRNHLLVFTRYPESGKVKTRLIPALGADGAALLHRQMTEHTLSQVQALRVKRSLVVEIYFTDPQNQTLMQAWLGESWVYAPQIAGDLGEKLSQAFTTAFAQGSTQVIAIGTDCPDLSAEIMYIAFEKLQTHDLVLGTATDGGYYLIGMRSLIPQLFINIDWGTDQVLSQTVKIATELGLAIAFLTPLSDIDRPEDLPVWEKVKACQNQRISVIIPVLNEANGINTGLAKTLANIQDDLNVEAIVVDGGSTDQTVELLRNMGIRVLTAPAGRASQMNVGAAIATGDILIFLHADTQLPPDFADMIRETCRGSAVGGAFTLKIDAPLLSLRLVEWGVAMRSRLWQLPYGDQAIFLKKATFQELGGFMELPIMEDFEFMQRLQKLGAIAILPTPVITSARRWLERGVLQTTLTNQIMILGYRFGISTHDLARWYRHGFLPPKVEKVRSIMLFLVVTTLAFLCITFPAFAQTETGFNPQEFLRQTLQWVQDLGAVGAIAFILIYILSTVAFFPGTVLTLGAGVVFGVVVGSLYVLIGATIGAIAAFLIGRYVARGWVSEKIQGNQKFQAIDEAVGREGLKIVLLTRLSPVFPFVLLNYAYGVTKVSFKDYVIGSIGMVPGTVMYVYIGSLAGNIAAIASPSQPTKLEWAIRIAGFVATIVATIYVTRVATKALATHVE